MRHNTRKINEENPLVIRGLYGGGGGGGGGGDSGDAIGAIGQGGDLGATLADMANTTPDNPDPGLAAALSDMGATSNGSSSPGQIASFANTLAGMFGLGVPSIGGVIGPGLAIGATAALGNMINGMTGFSGGTPGTGTGDPGSASSPGGGMASFFGDQPGNTSSFVYTANGWVPRDNVSAAYGLGGAGTGGYGAGTLSQHLTPTSPQEAQDWANNNFDPVAYLRANPDVAASGMDPWVHYYTYGVKEGRSPNGAPAAGAPAAAGPAAPNPNSPDAIRQAQLDLVQQQRDIATQMQQRQQALQDQLMAQQGYEPNGQGGYRLNATAQAAQDQQNQIAAQLRQRTLDALAGNLPVDPGLERGLSDQRATLENTLRSNLGSGFATSTPGIQALANFDQRAEELRAQARHDQLTTAQGLQLAGQQVANTASTQNLANVLGITNSGSVPAGLLSSAAGGLSPIGQNLLGYSALDNAYRIAQLTGQNNSSDLATRLAAADNAGYGALVGQLGSAFLRSDAGNSLIKNVGSGLGSLWDSIGNLFSG